MFVLPFESLVFFTVCGCTFVSRIRIQQEVGTPLASQYLMETHQLGSIGSSPYSFE